MKLLNDVDFPFCKQAVSVHFFATLLVCGILLFQKSSGTLRWRTWRRDMRLAVLGRLWPKRTSTVREAGVSVGSIMH